MTPPHMHTHTLTFTFQFILYVCICLCFQLLIIDSRSIDEYNRSHIANALSIINNKIIRKRLKSDKVFRISFHIFCCC